MIAKGLERTQVFISYSRKDGKWIEELKTHLKPLKRDQDIEIWDDTNLKLGSTWLEEIQRAIRRAKVVVLLISPNFMASDFIVRIELPLVLQAAKDEGAIVVPVILRRSKFDRDERLSCFTALNNPEQPLIDMAPGRRDVIFEKLAETIEG
jgi:TIR domain